MQRIIEEKLVEWKNDQFRKPLIVSGARQVGKTYSIKEFGQKYYNKFHLLDLERNPELNNIFKQDKNPKRIISELELFLNDNISIESDLLFFDEVQNSPEALASLRYFFEEIPKLNLIVAGSLIEFALKDISFPVGRVETLTIHPMNFFEFLNATNSSFLSNNLFKPFDEIPNNFHSIILEELKKYFIVGGMPEAVNTYIKTNSFIDVIKIQKNLLNTYVQDFSKYAGKSDKNCLLEVLFSTAKNVGNQTQYSKLADGFSNQTIKNAYNLLLSAKIISKIQSIDPSGTPLGASAKNKKFKTIFIDIGLMNVACELNQSNELLNYNIMNIYKGALAEQFVGQEFISSNIDSLYYWARESKSSTAEVDYVFSKNGKIFPIEVKSGPSGRLKSMHLLLEKYNNIKLGYVLSTAEYSILAEQKLIFLPIYFANRFSTFGANLHED
ncbi:MAG: AAA family ATPase [Bacteroidetes bacterium]|nr:AAA family ATPase [Bacteroidota bacterium]MBU1115757.1 AAA family ATPase [Bacteroidota bacterium]MBU1799455.1 AAA family ATPase [Bacteroidota bacterium]